MGQVARTGVGPPAPPLPRQPAAPPPRGRGGPRAGPPRPRRGGVRVRATAHAELARAARARRPRRGQRVRAELRAPRDRVGGRGVGTAPVDREARGPHGRDTSAIAEAVRKAGVQSAVGFNYRNAPAVERGPRARVASGRLGDDRDRQRAAAGRLLGASRRWPVVALRPGVRRHGRARRPGQHGLDLATYVGGQTVGRITELVSDQATFITERPSRDRSGLALRTWRRRAARPGRQRGPGVCAAAVRRRARTGTSSRRGSRSVSSAATASRSAARGRALMGLPPDGRAAALHRPGLPGRHLADPSRAAWRRRAG